MGALRGRSAVTLWAILGVAIVLLSLLAIEPAAGSEVASGFNVTVTWSLSNVTVTVGSIALRTVSTSLSSTGASLTVAFTVGGKLVFNSVESADPYSYVFTNSSAASPFGDWTEIGFSGTTGTVYLCPGGCISSTEHVVGQVTATVTNGGSTLTFNVPVPAIPASEFRMSVDAYYPDAQGRATVELGDYTNDINGYCSAPETNICGGPSGGGSGSSSSYRGPAWLPSWLPSWLPWPWNLGILVGGVIVVVGSIAAYVHFRRPPKKRPVPPEDPPAVTGVRA